VGYRKCYFGGSQHLIDVCRVGLEYKHRGPGKSAPAAEGCVYLSRSRASSFQRVLLRADAHQGSCAGNQQKPQVKKPSGDRRITAPVSGEEVCFPLAESGGCRIAPDPRAQRPTGGADHQCGVLATGCIKMVVSEPGCLGIESGLHQRLDVSHNDDGWCVHNPVAAGPLKKNRSIEKNSDLDFRIRI